MFDALFVVTKGAYKCTCYYNLVRLPNCTLITDCKYYLASYLLKSDWMKYYFASKILFLSLFLFKPFSLYPAQLVVYYNTVGTY